MESPFNIGKYYTDNFVRLFHYANLIINDEEEARDVVSDTFLKLIERHNELDITRNIPNLMVTMLRNRCMDIIRHRRHVDKASEQLIKIELEKVEDPEKTAISRELTYIVNNTLNDMAENERNTFIHIRFEGKSYKEMAQEMNISVRSVEYNLNKVQNRLRRQINKIYASA